MSQNHILGLSVKNTLFDYIPIIVMILIAVLVALAAANLGLMYSGLPIIIICMITSFIIHWLVFIPSYIRKTEKYYDLTGSIAYLSVTFLAIYLTYEVSGQELHIRSLLLALLISIWTLRLGLFLFTRILRAGEDKRFREIKNSFSKFLLAWTISGLWVFLTSANALTAIINNMDLSDDYFLYIGLGLWLTGFLFEVIADEQKKRFKDSPFNKTSEEVALAVQKFLASGGEVTTLPSPSATKATANKEASDSELVKEITKPLSRDRSIW